MEFVDSIFESMDMDGIRAFIDKALDAVENMVEASTTKWDDMIVLPLCKLIREVSGVPDDDD